MSATYRHPDGRLCRFLAYTVENQLALATLPGLRYGWLYGDPPELRRCDREDHPEPGGQDG